MKEVAFETSTTRPAALPLYGRRTPYTGFVNAALATLDKGGAVVVPVGAEDPIVFRARLVAKVNCRIKRDVRGLRARGAIEGGKVHVWIERKGVDASATGGHAVPPPTAGLTPIERAIVLALRETPGSGAGDALGLDDQALTKEIFGSRSVDHVRQIKSALQALSNRKLLLQDDAGRYTLRASA